MAKSKEIVVVSLGGSLIVPGNINWRFIKSFKKIIEKFVRQGKRFILITGGGKTARRYIKAAQKIGGVNDEDKDWIGIHATRLNAHFLRTILRQQAHPRINKNPHDLRGFRNFKEPILIAAGWRPGFSTDYDAVVLAQNFGLKEVINLSNIDYVYDSDPRFNKKALPLKEVNWQKFFRIVGKRWSPGLNAPFDPLAARLAAKQKMRVVVLNGCRVKNFERYLEGKSFRGSVIG